MTKRQTARQKVSFISTRKINVSRNVRFKTAQGKRVSFRARKTVSKPVKVTFYARMGRTRRRQK